MRCIKSCVLRPKIPTKSNLHAILRFVEKMETIDGVFIITFKPSAKLTHKELDIKLQLDFEIAIKEYQYFYYTGKRFMQWNPSITVINIPPFVDTLPNNAYSYCYGITNINGSEYIKSFGLKCFANTSIMSLKLNSEVKELPYKCCYGCVNLKSINVENISIFGFFALAYSDVEYLSIGSSVLPRGLCLGCKHLECINFTTPTKLVNHMTFFRCPLLKISEKDFDKSCKFVKCWRSASD